MTFQRWKVAPSSLLRRCELTRANEEITMAKNRISLERQILNAFTRAYAERRLEVADHLLQALEALQEDWLPGSELGEAYLTVGRDSETRNA